MKNSYEITFYEPKTTYPDLRFILGTKGKKPLFVIGLNPSTADDKIPDQTIKKVIGFAHRNDYDSFIMLNLYGQRTSKPSELHSESNVNEQKRMLNVVHITDMLLKYSDLSILAAWGENITTRKYLKKSLEDILEMTSNKEINWLKIGDLTKTGHPRHPSRAQYGSLTTFEIEKYLKTI